MGKHYTVHAVKVAADGFIDQVINQSISPAISALRERAQGKVNPTAVYVTNAAPSIAITTRGIAKALAAVGWTGKALSDAELFLKTRQQDGIFSSSGDHEKGTIAKGLMIPNSLSCDLSGAQISYTIYPTWDGTNEPIAWAAASLSGTISATEAFCAGPVSVNGSSLLEVQGWSLDFGFTPGFERNNDSIYPQVAWIENKNSVLTINLKDATPPRTFGHKGTAIDGSSVVAFLRKRADGSTFVADGTGEHISCTLNGGVVTLDDHGADSEGDGAGSLIVTPRETDSGGIVEPVVFNLATSIS